MKKSKFSESQIVRILQEAATGERTVADICRQHGVSQNTYYVWRRKFSGIETEGVRRLREVERENDVLKRLLAERDLEIASAETVFRKSGWALPDELRECR